MEYGEGALPEERAKDIEAHLDGCPGCAALLAKLKFSRQALSSSGTATMPQDASNRILASLRRATPREKPWTGLLRSRRALAFGAAALAALLAVIVVAGLKTGGPRTAGPSTKITTTNQSGFISSASEAERGQSAADHVKAGGPLPLVKFTATDYTPDSLRLAFDKLQVKKDFANAYTMSDAIALAPVYTRKAADEFANLGGDAPLLEAMVSYITTGEPTLLPCYVERARFQGKDCTIILLAGAPRSGGSLRLTRTEAWVMDPVRFAQNPDAGVIFFLEQK